MTGRGLDRTTEVIPRRPWKSKSTFASRPNEQKNTGTRRVSARYDAVLPPFMLIVRSYLGWNYKRDKLNGSNQFLQDICGFLRKSAVSCENLRFPAKICGFLRRSAVFLRNVEIPTKSDNLQKSATNCEFGSVCPF